MSSAPAQTYYVIMPQQPPDIGASIRPIARLLQEEDEQVRQRLVVRGFQVLRRFAKKANAEGLHGQLHALGITTIVISDLATRAHLFMWCKSARRGGGGMALADFSGAPLYCPYPDFVSVSILPVRREDGTSTTFIDLHRKSAPITPRLDAAMFNFPEMLVRADATMDHFLDDLEANTNLVIERQFEENRERMTQVVNDIAERPSEFAPTKDALPSPYVRQDLLNASIYSFLIRAQLIESS